MNASCMAVQCFTVLVLKLLPCTNLFYYINKGERYGIPVLGVVAVGKEMERTTLLFCFSDKAFG